MLLQALVEYTYSRLAEKLGDYAFEDREVPYLLEIRPDGSFAGVTERLVRVPGLPGRKMRGEKLAIPRPPVHRNTGIHALLGCDQIRYVVGVGSWTAKGREIADLERHGGFVRVLKAAASATDDAALLACCQFYDRADDITLARAEFERRKILPGRLVALSVAGPVVLRPAVHEYWHEHYWREYSERLQRGGERICLVCGRVGAIPLTHGRIGGLISLGGPSTGSTLVSTDKEAFCSYGWRRAQNSPVSPDCAAAYVLALNDLLRPASPRRVDHGETAVLFWTKDPIATPNPVECVESPTVDTEALVGEQTATHHDGNQFYLAALSPNGGRIIPRAFVQESLVAAYDHVKRWFRDLAVIDLFQAKTAAPPTLRQLLAALSPRSIASEYVVSLLLRAVSGRPLGHAPFSAALGELRRATGTGRLQPVRMAMLRICLVDLYPHLRIGETLEPDRKDYGYLSGRLFAMYEGIQHTREAGSGTRFADRWFAEASTRPSLALRVVEQRIEGTLQRFKRSGKRLVGARIQQELDHLRTRFAPEHDGFREPLSPESQALFALGYYYQKADAVRQAWQIGEMPQ